MKSFACVCVVCFIAIFFIGHLIANLHVRKYTTCCQEHVFSGESSHFIFGQFGDSEGDSSNMKLAASLLLSVVTSCLVWSTVIYKFLTLHCSFVS